MNTKITFFRLRDKHQVKIDGLNRHTEHRVLSVIGYRDNVVGALRDIIPNAALEAPYSAIQEGKSLVSVIFIVSFFLSSFFLPCLDLYVWF